MKKFNSVFWSVLGAGAFAAASAVPLMNQLGFTPDAEKIVIIPGHDANPVEVRDLGGKSVLKLPAAMVGEWEFSGEETQVYDISAVKTPGSYRLFRNGEYLGNPITVAPDVYEDLTKAALKWFYFQRAGMALEPQYAGKWARAAGHKDDKVVVYGTDAATAATVAKDAGKPAPKKTKAQYIKSPMGWYDAGDYGKYIVNSGITVWTLLALYEEFTPYMDSLSWNIPRKFEKFPAILEEVRYNLDWMLTMQAEDGSVYHKLTSLKFCDAVQPAADTLERFIIGKSATATLDFAAVMAAASRVYSAFDEAFASKCLEAAKKAYTWGAANTNVLYKSNPMGVETGAYNDGNASDELDFAAAELFFTTKDATYSRPGASRNIPGWAEMGGLVTYEKAIRADVFGAEGSAAKDSLLKTADEFVETAMDGFGVPMSESFFYWGSNSVAANQGIWLLHAYYVSGDEKYYKAALKALDYLLGKNPLDMSFVTGFGTKSPKHPHHRPSQSDNNSEPVPGMLVGGPQPGGEDIGTNPWECKDYRTGDASTAYFDDECSYASNEVAINWNSPLAYLAGAIEALNQGFIPSFANSSIHRGESVAIRGIAKVRAPDAKQSMLRFKDQMLYVEKNGVRYNLKGHVIK